MNVAVSRSLVACIVLAAVAFRMFNLNSRSVWLDEAFSWRLSTFSAQEIIQSAAADYNPPLYYLLLKGWIAIFGESAAAMRAMSGALGLATVVGAYGLASEAACRFASKRFDAASGRWAGLLAAAMVSVAPFQVRWSSEARMYTLAAALAIASNYFLLRAVCRSSSLSLWLAYVFTTTAALYSHTYCVFSLAAQCVWFGLAVATAQLPRSVLPRTLAAVFAVVLLFSPWLTVSSGQLAQVRSTYWIGQLRASDISKTFVERFIDPSDPVSLPWEPAGVAVVCAACLVGAAYRNGVAGTLVACSAVGPLALAVLVSLLDTPILAARYLIVAQTSMLVAFAVATARLPRGAARNSIAAVAVFASCVLSWSHLRGERERATTGARAAMAYVEERRGDSELVLAATPWHFLTALYYSHDRSSILAYEGDRDWPRHFGTAAMRRTDFLPGDLTSLVADSVWVIDRTGGGSQQSPFAAPVRWRELGVSLFPEADEGKGTIVVREYATRAAAPAAPH